MNFNFFKYTSLVLVTLLFVSCDKDYNSIGSNVVGDGHFDFGDGESFSVVANNQKTGTIQTNNLPLNQLGIIDNEVFGTTTAHFVTQLEMVTPNPKFQNNVVIDSVVLTVPYFSELVETESSGRSIYKLDSVYGSAKMDLSVYENGYYLKDLDPNTNFTTSQKYYSDEKAFFTSNKIGLSTPDTDLGIRLNNWSDPEVASPDLEYERWRQNKYFYPSKKEYVKYKVNESFVRTSEIESRNTPRLRMRLDNAHFFDKIFGPTAIGKLVNNNVFKDYFRGLYFEVNGTAGSLMTLNFKQGDVTIYYKQDKSATSSVREMREFKLNMSGTTVNLYENNYKATYANAVNEPFNVTEGSSSLYIKGGEGSGALIDILKDPSEKAKLKGNLINQAYLSFTINQTEMSKVGMVEPNRVYIYDADNRTPLYDYFFDSTTNSVDPKKNKYVFGGLIEKEGVSPDRKGVKYRINITEHVNNIVNNDSTNVTLGLVVTESVNVTGNAFFKTPLVTPTPHNKKIDRFPINSVMCPLGTVLYGTHSSVPVDKRVQFKVYYTKPN